MNLWSEYNTRDILWLGDWSIGWIVALSIIGALILGLSAYDLWPLKPHKKWTLIGLRLSVYILAVALLLEPAIDFKHVTRVKNHVAILVDTSESMTLPSQSADTSRFDETRSFLEDLDAFKARHAQDHDVHLFSFDAQLQSTSTEALGVLRPNGQDSHLGEAIEAVGKQLAGKELGGLIVLSDGTDTGTLGRRTARTESLDQTTQEALRKLRAPINTFVTGAQSVKDVAIARVLHDDFAFVHNKLNIDVDVHIMGVDEDHVDVHLGKQGQRLQTKRITLVPNTPTYRVSFELVPAQIGKEIYTIDIDPLKGEALERNNHTALMLRVIRDKVRVLHVVGQPSWDERFMRRLLKKNPNVDLISFFILRTNANIQRVPTEEMSLIPFPTRELFEQELGSFDLVIFQNFNFGPYNMRQYLPKIAQFVRDGGGFVMIGGDLSFASGGYARTPIEDILPVVLPPTTNKSVSINEAPFRPKLTPAGQRHPITQLAFDPATNTQLWATLPAQEGTNVVMGLRPGATALAEHPTLRSATGPMPVIAVSDVEKGRVMALTTDSSWRWGFEAVGAQGTMREYQLFWNNTIRWLIKDPELKLVRIELDQDTHEPSTQASIKVRVFNPDYTLASGEKGTLSIQRSAFDSIKKSGPVQTIPFETDAQGQAQLSIELTTPGAYSLLARVQRKDVALEDHNTLLVRAKDAEFTDILPRAALLQNISDTTNARHGSLATDALQDSVLTKPRTLKINRRRVVQLWDSWVVFLLIAGLLFSEWTLRRRWGRL